MNDKIKVLCVEDEVDIRENLAGILESEGFEVFQAENGKQGLEVFLEKSPDIIISDIMMPEVGGYEFLKSVRHQNIENNNVPFILLSALGQKEDILTGINLEASDYMVKPVDFDLLIAKIKEKTTSVKKNQEATKKTITNLKSQVSNIVPQEMLQYIDLINQISAVLKTEIYGPLPHKKYLEDLNKIYIHSLKLKTMINNFLSGESISNQLDVSEDIIQPINFLEHFIAGLNEKFQSRIIINEADAEQMPNVKVNKKILGDVVKRMVGCLFKINEEISINISIAFDHMERMVMIFYPSQTIDSGTLKSYIEKSITNEMLISQGLEIETLSSNNTNLILIVPNYRVVKKSNNLN